MRIKIGFDFHSERKDHKSRNFQALNPKRNSENGYAQKYSQKSPNQAGPKTDKYKPNNISQSFHCLLLF